MSTRRVFAALLLASAIAAPGHADPAPFDLAGPKLSISVTHGRETLPIIRVPSLSTGDTIAIVADLPPSQSEHFLLVTGFLRGGTNPPPKSWFHRLETWKPKQRLSITVPPGAQQVVLFLIPHTAGDYGAVLDAVRSRPGAFVRAARALDQSSLDRARLDAFLTADHQLDHSDPARLKEAAPLLARSLGIKLNTDCLEKIPELQAACLTQGQDGLVLPDDHATSTVDTLTSGDAADLAFQISDTPRAGLGVYSPYIGAIRDIVRILGSFRSAHLQYVPAVEVASGNELALELNAPPSFRSPRSVLVAALPPVAEAPLPTLRPVDPDQAFCVQQPDLLLPAAGAPLLYASHFGRDLALRLSGQGGASLPVRPDAGRGGLLVDTSNLAPATPAGRFHGTLAGYWGFQLFSGPSFHLEDGRGDRWQLARADAASVVIGREADVTLEGGMPACISGVSLRSAGGETAKVKWSKAADGTVQVVLPLASAKPGGMELMVSRYGAARPQTIALKAYAQIGRMNDFSFHAGDDQGLLTGTRLDEVETVDLGGALFTPGSLTTANGSDRLTLVASSPDTARRLSSGQEVSAKIKLRDGRTVSLKTRVAPERPSATLADISIAPPRADRPLTIRLGSDMLAAEGKVSFSLHSAGATRFTPDDMVEVAAVNGSGSALLKAGAGLTLVDPHTMVARLSGDGLGGSAFGPMRFRLVRGSVQGDWQPLITLVRLPELESLRCTADQAQCTLTGSNLFLLSAVGEGPDLRVAVQVPEGFPGASIVVPRPVDGELAVRLHDSPKTVEELPVPADPSTAAATSAGHAASLLTLPD